MLYRYDVNFKCRFTLILLKTVMKRKQMTPMLDVASVHPGSLWSLHPQYGSGSYSWPPTGRRHGAAGHLQPRLVHLHRLVLAWRRLHHPRPLRHGRSSGVFRWEQSSVDFSLCDDGSVSDHLLNVTWPVSSSFSANLPAVGLWMMDSWLENVTRLKRHFKKQFFLRSNMSHFFFLVAVFQFTCNGEGDFFLFNVKV